MKNSQESRVCPLASCRSCIPLTPNPEPNSIRNPLPSLGNNATLENIDGVTGYSYTCIDNGEVVVICWVECRGEYRNNRLMG